MRRQFQASAGLSMVMALGACGGGSSPASVSSVAPPISPQLASSLVAPSPPVATTRPVTTASTENFDTEEYRVSSTAVASKAIGAWQQGATGRGIKIGFVDTGLNPSLADFSGRIDASSAEVNGGSMSDVYGHGTANAGIAAAAKNGVAMQGIAYEATIVMMKADVGCPTSCGFPIPSIVKGIDGARLAGAKVLNLSIGGTGDSSISDAINRAANAGMVVVVGAGNSGDAPTSMATRIAQAAPANVIIVGGLGVSNSDGSINYDVPSIYTTKAGAEANNFLTAPGWLNAGTSNVNGLTDFFSGTSFAAPVVSGAVALLAQAFPTLTASQIVSLLFSTADDLGAPGLDDTFGHGRLNITKAFQPQGGLQLASSAFSPTSALSGSLPSAAGDAGSQISLVAVALDGLSRAYDVPLSPSLQATPKAGLLYGFTAIRQHQSSTAMGPMTVAISVAESRSSNDTTSLQFEEGNGTKQLVSTNMTIAVGAKSRVAFGRGNSSGLLKQLDGGAANAFLLSTPTGSEAEVVSFDRQAVGFDHRFGGLRLAASAEAGHVNIPRSSPADAFSYFSVGAEKGLLGGKAEMTVSRLKEDGTVLGGTLRSSFGAPGATTVFVEAEIERAFGSGWATAAALRQGWTAFSFGHLRTSAYSIDISKSNLFGSDQLAVRFSQPLRVERGSLTLLLPTEWNYGTKSATWSDRAMSLKPSGREVVVEAGYFRALEGGSASVHLFARHDPNHIATAKADVGGAVQAQVKF